MAQSSAPGPGPGPGPDPATTIKTRLGRVLDQRALEEAIGNGLARRERELTTTTTSRRRVRIKAAVERLAEKVSVAGRILADGKKRSQLFAALRLKR